jgi:hypothetical protein
VIEIERIRGGYAFIKKRKDYCQASKRW